MRSYSPHLPAFPPAPTRFAAWLLGLLLLAGAIGWTGCDRSSTGPSGQKYHCPMHPTYVADRPSDCPICGMKLVPIRSDAPAAQPRDAEDAAAAAKIAQVKVGQFYCPMGAEEVQDHPGKCSKCGMKLVEKTAEAAPAAAAVPGRVSLHLDPRKRQMIGLTLARVSRRELTNTIRTTAVVVHDETRYARIAPRFSGWVRRLDVNFTGAPVTSRQTLFTVYSPELLAAENDYLIAWRGWQTLRADASPESRASASNLWSAARRRLDLWEVGPEEIRALEERNAPTDEMPFRSPIAGHVVAKSAVAGKAFMAGESLFEVADLGHLWLEAWVAESDWPLMEVGLPAQIEFPYLGHRTFTAPITFLYPHMDPQTRRGRVRLELDNPDHLLRPDMWASVTIGVPRGERLVIPASAVIDTGRRFVAFVDAGQGLLQPRELKVGFRTEDEFEVLAGVKEGEQVVTRALFLVDSESQLKAAIAGMGEAGEGKP